MGGNLITLFGRGFGSNLSENQNLLGPISYKSLGYTSTVKVGSFFLTKNSIIFQNFVATEENKSER